MVCHKKDNICDPARMGARIGFHLQPTHLELTKGVRNSRSVTRANQVEMLDGNTISYSNGLIVANQSDAAIVSADIRLSDGMVHLIDTVLLP